MKFIEKGQEPLSLRAFIEKEQQANIHPPDINGFTKAQIEQKIEDYKTTDSFGKLKRFCGVAEYILEDYLKRKFR
jgi:hypothetical protein